MAIEHAQQLGMGPRQHGQHHIRAQSSGKSSTSQVPVQFMVSCQHVVACPGRLRCLHVMTLRASLRYPWQCPDCTCGRSRSCLQGCFLQTAWSSALPYPYSVIAQTCQASWSWLPGISHCLTVWFVKSQTARRVADSSCRVE